MRYHWLGTVSPKHQAVGDVLRREGDKYPPIESLDEIRRQLGISAQAVRDAVELAILEGAAPACPYPHPLFSLQHMMWHEGYHFSLILLALRNAGIEPSEEWQEEHVWGLWRARIESCPSSMILLQTLLETVPGFGDIPNGGDHASRAVLSLLSAETATVHRLAPDPAACPNCGKPVSSEASPYCGTACREEAAFVRQFRRCLSDGSLEDEERQASLGQVLWHLLGGGYPQRRKLVTERTWQQLLKRDGGACKLCGEPATTFDHIKTACNRPINLHAVCEACSKTKELGDPEFVSREDVSDVLRKLATRIAAVEPLRFSDDPDNWNWRQYVANRREAKAR